MKNRIRSTKHETKCIDLSFSDDNNPVIIGIRLVGSDINNRIEAALIGVLNYADESRRTVADVVEV